MKIDLQQFRKILSVFLKAEAPYVNIGDFEYRDESRKSIKDDFLFHFQLIIENEMISNGNLELISTLDDAGIETDISGNCLSYNIPLRLTQKGHDFANSLNSEDVFKQLQENFSDKPFEVIFDIGQMLLKHDAMKKLDQILAS